MKICQLCAIDFTLYHFLLPLMKAMRDRGHEVVGVCAKGSLSNNIEDQGFKVENINFKRNYDLFSHIRAYRQLVTLFKQERFDIVHVHTPIAALIGRLAAYRAGVPTIVYTAHGFYFHERQTWFIRFLFIALEWIGGRFTNILFTQSQEDADDARRYGLCRGVIKAIGNGVETERFYPVAEDDEQRAAMRAKYKVAPDEVVVLMVGRIVEEKGYLELFDAMTRVDAHLWVVGSRLDSDHAGSINDTIEKIKADPERSVRTQFLGYRDDVDVLMRAVDIFTLPSYREGMPRSIIEAMMSGLPVVATNIRGSREEVIDGETGYLVPVKDSHSLGNAIGHLVSNAATRKDMGSTGCARATLLYDELTVIKLQLKLMKLTYNGNSQVD